MDSENKGAVKYDGAKVRLELVPPEMIIALGEIFTYGANKYADHGWKSLPNAEERYYAALQRHLLAYRQGETHDPESGFHHLKHVLTNAGILLWIEEQKNKKENVTN